MKNPYVEIMPDVRNTWLDALEDKATPEQEQESWEALRADPVSAGRYIKTQVDRGRWKPEEAEDQFKAYSLRMEKGRDRGRDRPD